MAKYLVTGGAGFIGSHIVDALVFRGDTVFVIDNLSSGRRENINANAQFYCADLTTPGVFDRILKQCGPFDVVIHEAAKINHGLETEDPVWDIDSSVTATVRIVQACLTQHVSRFIYASSISVYGHSEKLPVSEDARLEPIYSYGIAKWCAEKYLQYYATNYGFNYHSLRYSNVYGPRQPIMGEVGVAAIYSDRIKRGQSLIVYGDGYNQRDYIYVTDAVRATLAMCEVGGSYVVNVGCGIGVSTLDLAQAFINKSGKKIGIEYLPERIGELGSFYGDIRRIQKLTTWRPTVSLDQGIEFTLSV